MSIDTTLVTTANNNTYTASSLSTTRTQHTLSTHIYINHAESESTESSLCNYTDGNITANTTNVIAQLQQSYRNDVNPRVRRRRIRSNVDHVEWHCNNAGCKTVYSNNSRNSITKHKLQCEYRTLLNAEPAHKRKRDIAYKSVIECGIVNRALPLSPRVFSRWEPYFNAEVEIFTAVIDQQHTPLYRYSVLFSNYSNAETIIRNFVHRYRGTVDGIYQATSYTHKSSRNSKLSLNNYFVTITACKVISRYITQVPNIDVA